MDSTVKTTMQAYRHFLSEALEKEDWDAVIVQCQCLTEMAAEEQARELDEEVDMSRYFSFLHTPNSWSVKDRQKNEIVATHMSEESAKQRANVLNNPLAAPTNKGRAL